MDVYCLCHDTDSNVLRRFLVINSAVFFVMIVKHSLGNLSLIGFDINQHALSLFLSLEQWFSNGGASTLEVRKGAPREYTNFFKCLRREIVS